MNTPVPPKSNKTMIIVVVICFLLFICLMICSLLSTGVGAAYYYSSPDTKTAAAKSDTTTATAKSDPVVGYKSMGSGVACRSLATGGYIATDFSSDSPIHKLSLAACQDKCDSTTGCHGVSYVDDSSPGTNISGECYIYIGPDHILGGKGLSNETCYYSTSNATAPTINTFTALKPTGSLCSSKAGIITQKDDYLNPLVPVYETSLDACKTHCSANPACVALTYVDYSSTNNKASNSCQLMKAPANLAGSIYDPATTTCYVKGS